MATDLARQTAPLAPQVRRAERLADAAVHMAGLLLAPAAAAWLLRGVPDTAGAGTVVALLAYLAGMAGMLAASAAYNLAPPGPWKERLRQADHAMIFAAIAGTYTPLLALRLPEAAALPACVLAWAFAAGGMVLKLAAPRRHERLGLALYLGLGWAGLLAAPWLAGSLAPATGMLILAGAAAYSVGVAFHLRESLRFHNAVWHALVLLAAGLHFLAIRGEFAAG